MFKVQQKGQLSLDDDSNGKMVKYSGLEVQRLRYYLNDMKLPVVFAVVGVQTEQAYWTVLQGNPAVEEVLRDAEAAGQQTVTVRLPSNLLPATAGRLLEEVKRCMDWLSIRNVKRLLPLSLHHHPTVTSGDRSRWADALGMTLATGKRKRTGN